MTGLLINRHTSHFEDMDQNKAAIDLFGWTAESRIEEVLREQNPITITAKYIHSDTHVPLSWGIPCDVEPGGSTSQSLAKKDFHCSWKEGGLVSGALRNPSKYVVGPQGKIGHSVKSRNVGNRVKHVAVLYPASSYIWLQSLGSVCQSLLLHLRNKRLKLGSLLCISFLHWWLE